MTRSYRSSINHAIVMLEGLREGPAVLTELAQRCQIDKGNASRIIAELVRGRIVERQEPGPRFVLGTGVVALGMAALNQFELPDRAFPILKQVAQETGETVHLAVPSGVSVVYLAKAESPGAIQMRSRVGDSMPIHSTGLGKAIMPVLDPEVQEQVLSAPIVKRTVHTVTDPDLIREEMARTRRRGYSVDREENEDGIKCVAAPVFGYDGRVLGAVSIAGPAFRMEDRRMERLGQKVVEAAGLVSERMGFSRWATPPSVPAKADEN